jgi:hypothetical protein
MVTPRGRIGAAALAATLAVFAAWVPAEAQAGGAGTAAGTFADRGARALWQAAADHRLRVDAALVHYVAVVQERFAVGLRMPLKDRTLYRSERAARIVWNRDGPLVVQVLGGREQAPVGPLRAVARPGLADAPFEPLHDRLFFGLAPTESADEARGEDFWFEHPLEADWRDGYRFATGDTLTLGLPGGRRLQAVELRVVPTEADVHRMAGSLWIEPESGALVRAVYRLADTFDAFRDLRELREEEDDDLRRVPGILKPWTVDLSLVAVEYGWWEGDVWLPRSFRAEGTARAGILRAPATVEMGYRVESVVTEDDLAAREAAGEVPEERHFATRAEALAFLAERLGGEVPYGVDAGVTTSERDGETRRIHTLVPRDSSVLLTSSHLPPPVWEAGPGFPSEADLRAWERTLPDLPGARFQRTVPWSFRWGLQRTDLVRYNRVEGLSVGARGQLRPPTPLGPLTLTATARIGVADRVPNARLEVVRETRARQLSLGLFTGLAAVTRGAGHLGPGNSVNALLFGRDDGDYYRRAGAELLWTPPSVRRRSFEVRAWGEHHRAVEAETDFALWRRLGGDGSFRPNLQAREGWEVGGGVALRPWWGTDPRLAQGGFELDVQAAGGDWEYARASLEGRAALPLPGELRLGLEAGGGTSWGDLPPQRSFLVGGPATLRGYAPATLVGGTYLRARAELARHTDFGAVALFGDAGWAAETRRPVELDQVLPSVGLGLSLVDGLIRLDGAWGLREPTGFRLDLYLDGIL